MEMSGEIFKHLQSAPYYLVLQTILFLVNIFIMLCFPRIRDLTMLTVADLILCFENDFESRKFGLC